jgi:hypothetical protein
MTDTELEVEYVLWEAEDPFSRPCESQRTECSNFALYRMLWVPSKDAQGRGFAVCRCGSNALCLHHKDWVLDQKLPEDIPFYYCRECKGFADLKGIEPLRGKT